MTNYEKLMAAMTPEGMATDMMCPYDGGDELPCLNDHSLRGNCVKLIGLPQSLLCGKEERPTVKRSFLRIARTSRSRVSPTMKEVEEDAEV